MNFRCRPTSCRIGSAISKSGVVENVGVSGAISFVVVIEAEISCINADFEAFPVLRPPYWISGMCQIYPGKVAKARPLIPSGSEMAAKRVVWGAIYPPPVHGMRVNNRNEF